MYGPYICRPKIIKQSLPKNWAIHQGKDIKQLYYFVNKMFDIFAVQKRIYLEQTDTIWTHCRPCDGKLSSMSRICFLICPQANQNEKNKCVIKFKFINVYNTENNNNNNKLK